MQKEKVHGGTRVEKEKPTQQSLTRFGGARLAIKTIFPRSPQQRYKQVALSEQVYKKFMRDVTLFTVSGKNPHDDAPDSLVMLTDFITGGIQYARVAKRLFYLINIK